MNRADSVQLKKERAARAALDHLRDGMILGIGTGSTVNAFIEMLGGWRDRLGGAVASSPASATRLQAQGIAVLDLNDTGELPLYVDGADEATRTRLLIKGGGAALTREKIIAAASRQFICIMDDAKLVDRLGTFPLPVEVIPMARALVARRLTALGGTPVWRREVVTDNGNHILDVHGLTIDDPLTTEMRINQMTGVVSVGLFAARPADLLLIGTDSGVQSI
ncbi:MAG: ribose-5-phosphate isomerase RpiA [Steroidobacterales bacterium]